MKKLLKKVMLVAMTVAIGLSTVSFAAAADTPSGINLFTEVDKPNEALIQPLINSDGTMTFSVSKGSQLWSTEFKVSDTSTRFTHTTSPTFPNQATETTFEVTLQKKGLFGIWSDVGSAVTMTANGTSRQYDWTGLNTSTTYKLYFYSPNYAITGSGSLSNYVHP
ncbi:MAG: hypothetical protein E6600_04100 [Anaerocolumna aminovalerica]|uniref:hypothetical protein n=1 Tax=Anaerocolumna aminovalerica TaxID=1527 RepID=UPI0029156AC6|nr:hypothetical protein [Anaerocolumna aminovalerica]MDU6263670.1 hypothetical protein [Anaerocolumna aminovalerica]